MTFLPKSLYLDNADMVKFIMQIPTTGWTWKPVGITWHNTGGPTLKQWDAYPQPVRAAWGDNLDHYYKFDKGWHAGPHACGTPDGGIVIGEFRADGVHASCFNHDHFGIETIGDFRHGSDDPLSGRGLTSMQSSANIIAALCLRMGWEPRNVINFHRMCIEDHHACPGDLVTDAWAIGLAEARLAELHAQYPSVSVLAAPVAPPSLASDPTVSDIQEALVAHGQKIAVDGVMGPATRAAILKALSGA